MAIGPREKDMPRKARAQAEGRVRKLPKKTMPVITNREVKKSPKQLDAEIKHVTVSTTRRRGNNLTTEDQEWHLKHLRDARGGHN